MRTSSLVTGYIQAVIFTALGIRCVLGWIRERDTRSAHLAWAAGLYGVSSLISAASTTFYNQQAMPPETPPRALNIASSIVLYLAIYGFLLFLSDFIKFHPAIHVLIGLTTIASIVFAIIERPDLTFDPKKGIVKIPGIHNPIEFRSYIGYALVYLAIAFGVLAFSFLVYGFRAKGVARFRMLSIGAGFFLFFVLIGLLPRLLFGNPSAETINTLLNVLRWVALAIAPLLFVGFSPPQFIKDIYGPVGAPPPTRSTT